MRLKQRPNDFRVRELLAEHVVQAKGEHRVYRVTKTKLTSREAAKVLADEAGSSAGDVSMAGLKDRQGVTVQFMSLPRGRDVRVRERDILIESVGFSAEPLQSSHSLGNAFELTVRDVGRAELATLRTNLPFVREHGLPNFFDEQRFGNLRHGQGWIARRLMLGEEEGALWDLIAAPSPFDNERSRIFKGALERNWGDWRACRDLAGKFGEHHSIFEHLISSPEDAAGAFYRVSSRLRLIHLYAWQSHLWNRAVTNAVRELVPFEQRHVLESPEGPLVCPGVAPGPEWKGLDPFRLPGPRLEDVTDEHQRALFTEALAKEGLTPEQWDIQGVPGFQLKGEDRPLFVVPRHLRVRPAEPDRLNPGQGAVRLRFELPRGSYATLVVKRLLSPATAVHRDAERGEHDERLSRDERQGREDRQRREERGGREREDRGDRRERGDRGPREHAGAGGRGGRPGGWSGGGGERRGGRPERGPGGGAGGRSDRGKPGGGDPWGEARRAKSEGGGRSGHPRRSDSPVRPDSGGGGGEDSGDPWSRD